VASGSPPTTTHGEPARADLDHAAITHDPTPVRRAVDRDGRSSSQLHDANRSAVLELHQQVMGFDVGVGDRHITRRRASHEMDAGRQMDDSARVGPRFDAHTCAVTSNLLASNRLVKVAVHKPCVDAPPAHSGTDVDSQQ
jgi:hypothetical protein